jgi:hypothetical protein
MVQGLISMEVNEFCINELADKVTKLMNVGILLKDESVEENDDKDESRDEEPQNEATIQTPDEVEEMICELKMLVVQLAQSLDEFGLIAADVVDAGNRLCTTVRKIEKKQRTMANKSSR